MKKFSILTLMCMLCSILSFGQNYALDFDGSSDYVTVSAHADFELVTGTIECWIYNRDATSNPTFLCSRTTGGSPTNRYAFNLRTDDATGTYIDRIGFYDGTYSTLNYNMSINTWYHLAFVCDGSNTDLYVNGISVGTFTQEFDGSAAVPVSGLPITFGAARNGGGTPTYVDYLNGKMDEIRFWNDERTITEIRENMYNELSGSESNLVAYYKMSNGSGTTLTDNETSATHTGTLAGTPDWRTSGAFSGPRNALDFDGTNDYVSVPHTSSLAIGSNPYSLEVWANPENVNQSTAIIYKRHNSSPYEVVGLMVNDGTDPRRSPSSGKKISFVFGYPFSDFRSVTTVNDIVDGNFHHIVATVNPTTSTLKLYIDGIEQSVTNNEDLGNFPSIGSYYNPQYTFGQNNGNTQWFTGHLDEVRIWSKVLTETEIRENMCKTLEGNETGLAAYFRFDQESGTGGSTTLYDLTSNGNDGTLNNMDATTDWVSSSVFNTWIGSEGTTTWATDANWSTGTAPVSTDNVGIYDYSLSSDPVIPSGTEVNHLLIGSSTLAEVSEGNTLDVNGNLLVNGTFTVASNAMASSGTGSLIVDGSAAGNVIVERYVDGGSGGYNHFVSAPISDATGNDLASDYNIYEYQDTLQNWNRIFTGNSLTSGIGYTTAYNSNKTISYTGTLNTGTVNVYVNSSNINAAYSDYNMVGNPYSSRINASAFVNDADNSEISGALYFWTDDHGHASGYTTDDFATWTITGSTGASANGGADTVTPNRYIESGQGFFVYAPTSGGAIKFKNSHQVHSSPRSFFTPEINTIQRVWLTLSNDEFNYSNDILIGFLEDATEGYDRLYDAVKNQGNENLSFYSIIENDDRNFVIQGLPIPTSEKEIKLGYFAKQAGIYTIDIDNMERFDGYSIVLVDKEMNITVNLLETDYSFTTASGEFDERFSLFISAKSSSVEEANQDVKIYSSENLIYLNIPQDENYCISVYDMLGKKVYSSIPSSIGFQSIDLGLKTGFYLVKVKNETSEYTEKVFLK